MEASRIWVRNMGSKKVIRKRILETRAALSYEEQAKRSDMIAEKVIHHSFFLNADCIYCYVDYNAEVYTRAIIEAAWDMNKKVAVPKIEGDEIHFYYLNCFSDLQEGYRGILEPITTMPANDGNALVIMPGVAYDKARHRIGYGKGFYDKFLKNHHGHTIALGYELQIVDYIPFEEHDFSPNVIITEETIYDSFTSK